MFAHTERLARLIGEHNVRTIAEQSRGMRARIPIAGTRLWSYDGYIVHDIGGGGFASMSDLISEATSGGKRQDWTVHKSGSLATSAAWASLWNVGALPPAGGAVTAIPGGAVPTRTTNGALRQTDAVSGDTLHVTTLNMMASTAPNTMLMYDRIWHGGTVDHTIATSQSITGVPTRYDTTTSPGNFAFLEVTTALGATAQNVTLTYVDQDGNTAEAASALAIIASSVATRICHTPFFIPLNAGDTGLRKATAVQFSAGNSAGASALVLGHPIAWIPLAAVAYKMEVINLVADMFSLPRVLDGAALAFLEFKGVATATDYTGSVILVSG